MYPLKNVKYNIIDLISMYNIYIYVIGTQRCTSLHIVTTLRDK